MVHKIKYIKYTILFLIVILLTGCLFFVKKEAETNLLKTMLPENLIEKSDIIQIADKTSSVIKVVFEADDINTLEKIKKDFSAKIDKKYFDINRPDVSALVDYYLSNPENFLSYKTSVLIRNKKYDEVYKNGIEKLYNPAGIQLSTMDKDPYFLFDDFIMSNNKGSLAEYIIDGKFYDYTSLKIKNNDGLSPDIINKKIAEIVQVQRTLSGKSSKIYLAGTPVHSFYSSAKSKITINIICILSTLLIIFLTYVYFKSSKPVLPVAISIGIGMLTGFIATNLFFERFQIITMVFSTTLIGIGIDYSYHYFFAQKHDKQFVKNLTYSLITTIIPFLLLLFTGIELLQQIAVFTVFGLTSIYLTVLIFYPCFELKKPVFSIVISYKLCKMLLILLSIFTVLGFFRFSINDNLSSFYKPSQRLLKAENLYTKVSGEEYNNAKFITIEGNSIENLMEKEEKITDYLNKKSVKYMALSKFLPSEKRQKENFDLTKDLYFNNLNSYSDILTKEQIKELQNKKFSPVSYSELKFPYLNHFLLSQNKSIIIVFDKDFVNTERKDTEVTDIKSDLEKYIKNYRHKLFVIFSVSTAMIYILLAFLYGIKNTVKILAPPYLGILSAIGLSCLVFGEISLFGFITLFLLLGFTIDYSIFRNSGEEKTEDAIFISCLTTTLSFFLLVFSGFKLIISMAVILSLGIFVSYLAGYIIFNKQ